MNHRNFVPATPSMGVPRSAACCSPWESLGGANTWPRPSRGRASIIPWLAIGTYALSACGTGGDRSAAQRTDSAGIEIVRSIESDRVLQWEFQRLFQLGGADEGPEAFFVLSTGLVDADADGNLFVLDPPNSRVAVFDADGHYLRSMGGSGGGPGEFQSPASMSVAPDGSVAVFDFGKGNLVRFDAGGQVDVEQPFPLFPAPNRQRHFAQSHDTTWVSTTIFSDNNNSQRQVLSLIARSDTLVLMDLPLPQAQMAMFMECGGGLRMPPIFAPEIAWDARAGTVALAASVEYSISFMHAARLTRIVRRAVPPTPAARDLAVEYLGEGVSFNFGRGPCLIDPGEMVDKRGYADLVPIIQTILLGPTGELWVQRFTLDPDATPAIDVFDTSGDYVGTLVRDSFQPVVLLPGDRVGVVEKDESDVERLVVLSIRR